jgi:4-carboxymuconolactone decarboxylase
MTRIPYVRREELGPEGQQLWDSIVNGRGDLVVTADGGLAGPFNAFVTAPGAGRRMSSLGATLRFGTSIERRLSEIAIITIGARWQAEFEWWAHAPMAREHGVAEAVVDAIGRGEDPPFEADDERAVYTVARQLSHSGRLDQETYDAAHRFLGDAGMVELVSLCGYYTLVSFLLNAFTVPLPPDAAPMWAGSRLGDRLHQLGGEPARGDRDSGVRRVEGGTARYLPAGRAGGNGPRNPGQPRGAEPG